jgi:hypothetical protein
VCLGCSLLEGSNQQRQVLQRQVLQRQVLQQLVLAASVPQQVFCLSCLGALTLVVARLLAAVMLLLAMVRQLQLTGCR